MADPEAMLKALLSEDTASAEFPEDAPVQAAVGSKEPGSGPVEVNATDGQAVNVSLLHPSPRVLELADIVTAEEAKAIIQLGRPLLTASPTGAADKGYRATVRTSTSAALLDEASRHPAVLSVRQRVANLTGYPEANLEPLQLVRYLPGQSFEPHNDWFDACDVREAFRGGERRLTVLVYLNSVPDDGGGGTRFPELGVRVRPRKHGGVLFENYRAESPHRGDARCLHEGEAPSRSTKLAANIWIRARSFRL